MLWVHHINSCRKKLSHGIHHVQGNKYLQTLYYSLVHPYLSYNNLIWGSACQKHLHKLEILQKKAIRIITKSAYNEHTSPLSLFHKYSKTERPA